MLRARLTEDRFRLRRRPSVTPPSATRPARRSDAQVHSPSAARRSSPVAKKAGWSDLDVRAVDTVRVLAADAVQKVGNGHPGTAMSLAPVAYLLYQNVMTARPDRPRVAGSRPLRPVLRALQPHAVHPALPLRLRAGARRPQGAAHVGQPHSGSPGGAPHQGRRDHHRPARLGSGVRRRDGDGPASAAGDVRRRRQAGHSAFDHHVFVLASDGDMQEGVTHEACALAATRSSATSP